MTTIHPERLRAQAAEVAELIETPPKFKRALAALLQSYVDRTRRPSASYRADDAAEAYGVPAPVLRALHRALEEAVGDHPGVRQRLVHTLWQSTTREPRQLAVWLAGGMRWQQSVEWVAAVAPTVEDTVLERALVEHGLREWQSLPPDRWLELPTGWLAGRKPALKRLGLRLLEQQVKRADPASLVDYMHALEGALGWRDDARRRLLRRVLAAMIARSPAETAQFLLDQLAARPRATARDMVRSLAPEFPPPQRQAIRAAIKAS